jgi:probable F420-dependent oxidoreductase
VNPRVRFGIAIPQTFIHEPVSTELIRDVIERAEAFGFHSAWVQEEILGATATLEPVELLTYVAAVTRRLRLGTAVLLSGIRSPVHLAKSLATLDHLSHGRLIVGVGLGGSTGIYPAYGISAERRTARFAAGIELMRRLWVEPLGTFESEFWTIERASLEPKPVQKPHPPIWVGAQHPTALRRALELGEGFIGAGASSLAEFTEAVRILHRLLADRGRDPALFPISKRVYVAVDSNRRRAGVRLEEWFGRFYGTSGLAAKVAVWGEPQECIDALAAVAARGAQLIILNPVFDELEQLERLTTEVMPHVDAGVAR